MTHTPRMTRTPRMTASLCTLDLNTFKINKTFLICSYRSTSSASPEKSRGEEREVEGGKREEGGKGV